MANEKYRGRVHMVLLYPDNDTHVDALDKIVKSYDHCGILHDRDIWNDDSEEHKKGDLKKAHHHVIIRTKNATWNSALAGELGIDIKFIEQVKNTDNALQYLIHYNDSDKTQYAVDEVYGSMRTKLSESINKCEKSEGEKVVELINYIEMQDTKISLKNFATFCATNGYWAEFRRSASIFIKIIEEHNSKYCLGENQ